MGGNKLEVREHDQKWKLLWMNQQIVLTGYHL